ncbi:hypothetical protein ACVCFC_09160 [Klebsiella oxytoca]|uniref:hypothetical protein n=1 Tax=Klebsiella oxytoca TaxID=571 RepID=UPI001113160A|nr:hypothetical protein [Klebsiella oxytoca]EKU7498994.1 hypothetical protein [Klebsiella oxytoca]EKW9945047.1 hypothetical protein [Klebsiella oxytoca]ELR2989556.1 hypothetical protein [Klebsiella oxytoca]MBG2735884.1 hypothetical protein [Klebsiella oxytoca]MBM9580133.1 hypothetical protein [Klebsiella oxytoca]
MMITLSINGSYYITNRAFFNQPSTCACCFQDDSLAKVASQYHKKTGGGLSDGYEKGRKKMRPFVMHSYQLNKLSGAIRERLPKNE